MVNVETPPRSQMAAGSSEGTPHLIINQEAAVDLDSTNVFEGPEKLLEVWFSPSADALPASAAPGGLKAVPAAEWKEMLDLVNCKVLSVMSSEHVDAYLLSESSMFVFPHKLILKTCGTTTLLCGIARMLEIAGKSAGFVDGDYRTLEGLGAVPAVATPYRVFYSRKNFRYPDQQRAPHRSWNDEVRFLDKLFAGGSAYMVGKMNGEHWYLYITGPNMKLTPPASPVEWEGGAEAGASPGTKDVDDETLELLMTDLDPAHARSFYLDHASAAAALAQRSEGGAGCHDGASMVSSESSEEVPPSRTPSSSPSRPASPLPDELTTEGHALGTVVSETCGLSDVYPSSRYPDARIDAYLFTPCGFSANGIVPSPGALGGPVGVDVGPGGQEKSATTHYFTVHVTPEPHCSYASFETNVPGRQTGRETADIVEQVVSIFRPGRFSVTIFEATVHPTAGGGGGGGGSGCRRGSAADEVVSARRSARMDSIAGYRRLERIVHDLNGYELVFRYYERLDWIGDAAPRLGEAAS
ncbi:MAG: spermidine resistance protein [Phylliscum demangeonii]|nr:MAG: spermidine resistance protein [Phylliscum demangeonii]